MRFVFFIINSAIFMLYCLLASVILKELIPLTREINESQLYAQTLITIEFVDPVIVFLLWSLLFSIIMALIIGIYSRKPINKLDRKIFFSKKGFLVNISLVITLFIGIAIVDSGSARIKAESEFEKFRVNQDKNFQNDFDRAISKMEIVEKPTIAENATVQIKDNKS